MKMLIVLLAAVVMCIPGHAGADVSRGSAGADVKEVQTILKGFGYTVIVDGTFGAQTEKAVRSWQKSNRLTPDGIVGPLTLNSLRSATRMMNAHQVTPTVLPSPTGLNGLPFAPEGLSDCAEATFYRQQAGLPDAFDALIWRESNCRNEDSVRTFCCHGYLQLYVSLHLKDHRLVDGYHACGVFSAADMNSDVPIEKQRSLCAAKVLYDVNGLSPWQ